MAFKLENFVTVSLNEIAKPVNDINMNAVAVITSEQTGVNTLNRYKIYFDAPSVATDFGTNSQTYTYAKKFFGISPNPTNANGYLIAGYWRGASENIPASAGYAIGDEIVETTALSSLQTIADGSFTISIDGTAQNVIGLDFTGSANIYGVVDVINGVLTGAVASYENSQFTVTSSTTGATSTVSAMSIAPSGTDVSYILSFVDGVTIVDGAAAQVLVAETKEEALNVLISQVNFKGVAFLDQLNDTERLALAQWCQANEVLGYEVYSSTSNLEINSTNNVWDITTQGLTNWRMFYSPTNQKNLAVVHMSRLHTMNLAGTGTAITMNLKSLTGVTPEDADQTVILKAERVGLDLYSTLEKTSKSVIKTSSANDFVDNRYFIIAFVSALKTDMFNFLANASTKIPQTQSGINQMSGQIEKTIGRFIRNGFVGAGTWNSSTKFGNFEAFDRAIETQGYYVFPGELSDQSQIDREDRKSVPFQIAVKLQGAVHSIDLIVTVEK